MKFFKLLILVSHLSFFISMSQVADSDKKNKNKSIDSLTVNFEKLNGLIIVYKNKEKVYFEIDDSLLTRDLLMVTRIVKSPSDFQAYKNAGSKTSEQLIQFVKKKEKIFSLWIVGIFFSLIKKIFSFFSSDFMDFKILELSF